MATTTKRLTRIAPLRAELVLCVLLGTYALVVSVIAKAALLLRDDTPTRVVEMAGWVFVASVRRRALDSTGDAPRLAGRQATANFGPHESPRIVPNGGE